jgi:uncharacterized protein YggT (Ycf19 family)
MQPIPTITPPQPSPVSEIMWPKAPVQPLEPAVQDAQVQPVAPIQPPRLPQQAPSSSPPTNTYYAEAPAGQQRARSATSTSATYRAAQIVYLILGIVEALVIARVALKLLAANGDAGFVRFVYGLSAPLVTPFQGVFPTPAGNGSVVEFSSLVAIAVYAAAAWAIVRVVSILGRQRLPTTAR